MQRWRTRNANHRGRFRIGSGNAGKGCQIAHAIGGDQRPSAFEAGIAVGGVSGVQLVTVANEFALLVMLDGFQ
ncbi:hypothetical protein D3C76_1694810 [compost metagenome]